MQVYNNRIFVHSQNYVLIFRNKRWFTLKQLRFQWFSILSIILMFTYCQSYYLWNLIITLWNEGEINMFWWHHWFEVQTLPSEAKSDRMESFKKWSHLENYFKLIYPIISCSIGVMIHIDIRVWRYEKMQRSQNMINIWNYCWINLSVLQETICKFVLIRKKNEGRYYLPNQWMKWGNCNLNDSI